jgi:hypothetical protein
MKRRGKGRKVELDILVDFQEHLLSSLRKILRKFSNNLIANVINTIVIRRKNLFFCENHSAS